ncbi:MAG: class I SAM-dependent methyltransferase [Anaerolineales bacterium]
MFHPKLSSWLPIREKRETLLIWVVEQEPTQFILPSKDFPSLGLISLQPPLRGAQKKASEAGVKPEFIIHDVTRLDFLNGPFDIALDVGCFHGMNSGSQQRYALELIRLMQPEGTLLIWGMDPRPLGLVSLIPDEVEKAFTPGFKLERVDSSQVNQRQGKWYWLTRQ